MCWRLCWGWFVWCCFGQVGRYHKLVVWMVMGGCLDT